MLSAVIAKSERERKAGPFCDWGGKLNAALWGCSLRLRWSGSSTTLNRKEFLGEIKRVDGQAKINWFDNSFKTPINALCLSLHLFKNGIKFEPTGYYFWSIN